MGSLTLKAKPRESSFELMRIIAQFMIILYHLLLVTLYPYTSLPFYKAIWLPLHIGVPLFVMISGYFGIKANVKRLIQLVGIVFILQVPLQIVDLYISGGGKIDYCKTIFFISNTPFWFIRTYVFLFLFSPVINSFIRGCSSRKRVLLLIVLFFISHYIGTMGTDPSLVDGKNLVTFIFFYVVGDSLHVYKNIWTRLSKWYYLGAFIIINVVAVALFTKWGDNRIAMGIYNRVFFHYYSVGLLLNSILFFMFMGCLHFCSPLINRIAKASLAMYMLHCAKLIGINLLPSLVLWSYYAGNSKTLLVMMLLMVLTLAVVLISWILYEIMTPCWKVVSVMGDCCQKRFDDLFRFLNL